MTQQQSSDLELALFEHSTSVEILFSSHQRFTPRQLSEDNRPRSIVLPSIVLDVTHCQRYLAYVFQPGTLNEEKDMSIQNQKQ